MLVPVTLMVCDDSGLGAGPETTEPSLTLNLLPWHGQSIVPSATWSTVHCMCVQTALKPLKSPGVGWVTTTLSLLKTMPPPTGIWLVEASALPPPAALVAAGAAPPPAPALVPVPADELPEPPELQALIAPARPARPTPASTPRRVARVSRCGSSVTSAPFCSVVVVVRPDSTLPCVPLPGYENEARAGRVHGLP